jgi:PBP1b-binding outer membrane lipoprotein LpoB
MPQQCRARSILIGLAALLLSGCSSQEEQLQQHAAKMVSLRATTNAIGNAWLQGDVSGAYAGTALNQTFRQVEQERAAVAKTPETLAEPRAIRLVREGEQLSRAISALAHDVSAGDGSKVRLHLNDLTESASEHR